MIIGPGGRTAGHQGPRRLTSAGQDEFARNFRRLRGHRDLATLIRALDRVTMDSRKEVA